MTIILILKLTDDEDSKFITNFPKSETELYKTVVIRWNSTEQGKKIPLEVRNNANIAKNEPASSLWFIKERILDLTDFWEMFEETRREMRK